MRSHLCSLMGMSHHFFSLAGGAAELQCGEKSLKPSHVLWECTRHRKEDEHKANRQQKMKQSGCAVQLGWGQPSHPRMAGIPIPIAIPVAR